MLVSAISPYKLNYYPKISDTKANPQIALQKSVEKECLPENLSFPSYEQVYFLGTLTDDQKKKCGRIIHASSGACAAVSAVLGEGAAIGMDTFILRGIQGLMFLYMQHELNLNFFASMLYAIRQYQLGAFLGVEGARIAMSWLGIPADAATAGAATVAVRGVNATLSGLITEKMGWGYLNNYKRDMMTPSSQLLNTALYEASIGLAEFFGARNINHDLDPSDISDIKDALKNIKKGDLGVLGDLATLGSASHTLLNQVNVPRLGGIFVMSSLQWMINTRNMDEKSKKEYFKNILKFGLLNTLIFEILDISENTVITEETKNTINNLAEHIKQTPDVYEEFNEIYENLLDKINIDNLSSKEFLDQFKKPGFVTALACDSADVASMLSEKWLNRNSELMKEKQKLNKQKELLKMQAQGMNGQLTNEDIKNLNKDVQELFEQFKAKERVKGRSNFGLSNVAGYEGYKTLFNIEYIEPIKKNQFKKIPNVMLFYGPSGMGKTLCAGAIAEEAGVKYRNLRINFGDESKTLKSITDILEASENEDKHTIIQIDEFDDLFANNPQLLDKFVEITKDCSQKYKTTFILTTNNPLTIHPDILKNAEIKTAFGTPTDEDMEGIIKFYLNGKPVEGINYQEIIQQIKKRQTNGYYNIAQIKEIITYKLPKTDCTQQDIIKAFENTNPRITKENYQKFLNEQEDVNKIR